MGQGKLFGQYILGLILFAGLGLWILNLIWPPLTIPFLLVIAGAIIAWLRTYFMFSKNFEAPILSCILGGLIALMARFGCLYANSPLWFSVITYLIGVFPAAYIGFRTEGELFELRMHSIEDHHALSQAFGIIVYIGVLVGSLSLY
jgi:hypothetical protein